MSEDLQLNLDKEKFMKYLEGESSFKEWKDGEMLHSLMVSNPLKSPTPTPSTTATSTDSLATPARPGPSMNDPVNYQPSPVPSTPQAAQRIQSLPGSVQRSPLNVQRSTPVPRDHTPSQWTSPTPFGGQPAQPHSSTSRKVVSRPGSSSDVQTVQRPLQTIPSIAVGYQHTRGTSSPSWNTRKTPHLTPLAPKAGKMIHPVIMRPQPGPSSHEELKRRGEALKKMQRPVAGNVAVGKSVAVSPKTPHGSSQTSLGGNFLIIMSDNSLIIKLPDIKKEVELDEEEVPEAVTEEEVEFMEVESGDEGDSDVEAGSGDGVVTAEDSTDTEIRKNVAEMRKLGIKKRVNETPTRRPVGRKRGPRVNTVPKHLEGLMGEANLCYARCEYEDAATMCLEVVRQAPRCPEPYQLLSLLYEEKGEYGQSLEFAVLAAHLSSSDVEEWRKVIEMCMDQDKKDMALYCYSNAIKYSRNKVPFLRDKIALLKEMGDEDRVYQTNRALLRYLPPENVDEYMGLAREMTKSAHQKGEDKVAMQIMSEAVEKYKDHISFEDVNMMAELLMSKKDYRGALGFLVKYCGVVLNHPNRKRRKSEDSSKDAEDEGDSLVLSNLTGVVVPDDLPIDLKVMLAICLIHLEVKQSVIQASLAPLFEEDIASFGDLYLDVAEAYSEKGSNKKARPILAQLVRSPSFNQPAVWLRYADCLNSLGDWTHAAVAFKKVLDEVPNHLEARLTLATIEQQAGRTAAALRLLSSDPQEEELQDIQLAYRKCLLLNNTGQLDEFVDLAVGLLIKYYCKGQDDTMEIDEGATQFSGESGSISHKEWYDLLVMVCRTMNTLGRFQEMEDVAQMAYNHEKHMEYHLRKEYDNVECLLMFAMYFNKRFDACYNMLRTLSRKYAENDRFMNLFSLVTNCANASQHYRFCLRMTIKLMADNRAFCCMNAFNMMMRGSYKHALGEFVRGLRQDMESPILNMCIGLCFFHIANQKFTDRKHSVILQGFAFLKRYERYRGVCQETYYNIGRALQGAGLLHLAIHYYHRALEMRPAIQDERFDLRREIAHNLSLIYFKSDNKVMAAEIISKYCTI